MLRNVRIQVTHHGPSPDGSAPHAVTGELAIRHGAVQLIGGLLIAGPLALVPLLGGGFPWTILLGPAVGLPSPGWFPDHQDAGHRQTWASRRLS